MIIKLASSFKPEYLYQARLALRRLLRFQQAPSAEFINCKLPWGMEIRVRPDDEIGQIVSTLGVMDLSVTETLWRLVEPGELAVDVGANIGYMTAVLAARVSTIPGGCVQAFEAHPEIFQELKYNIERWQKQIRNTQIYIKNIAISNEMGQVRLKIPDSFNSNRGLVSVITVEAESELCSKNNTTVTADSHCLDDLFLTAKEIGVLKLDVEGHELQVIKGANNLLKQKRIRDCVFEEHREYPTDVTSYFETMGYSLFRIQRKFFSPMLLPPDSKIARTSWEPTSFLATHQPERALRLLKKPGWKVLNDSKNKAGITP